MVNRAAGQRGVNDRLYDAIVYAIGTFALVITLYPFVYVLSASISSARAVLRGEVILFPKGFSLNSYRIVFADKTIWRSYYNTIWYTVVGTALNVVFTIMAAYPLSKKKFFLRGFFMVVFIFTMYFGGGMIPTFVLMVRLGLYGTRWAIVVPSLISTWNLIVCRTFFQSLPEELFECARIEGSSEWRVIWKIVIPLSTPIVAVLALFYGVAHWNSWFPATLYLPKTELHPIQVYLRRVLIQQSSEQVEHLGGVELVGEAVKSMMQIKYAVIIVAITPILVLYPFLQRYFVKGVMIGSLKG
jgi:putative aldouronate transport system permease protein